MDKKTLRGAVIGYGFVSAKGHVPAYLERSPRDVEIVAVADISPVRRDLAQASLPQAHIYNDYRSLLEAEGARLDFIDISTPPCDHAAVAHAALDDGIHVLCEKPLTRTIEEARSLLNHAKDVQRVLFPCHNYKHAPAIKTIREIIHSGRIGNVRSVTLNTDRDTHAKGVAHWNCDWRRDSRFSGGGIAMDHGSHCFYLTFDWLGSYPTSVTAKMSNHKTEQYDTEDDFTAVLTFPTGSARVHLTWTAGARQVSYTVEGDRGAIHMTDDELHIVTVNGTRNVERMSFRCDWADASHAGWFNSLFDEFRQAIARDDFVGKEAEDALMCVRVINTAYQSAHAGSRQLPLV